MGKKKQAAKAVESITTQLRHIALAVRDAGFLVQESDRNVRDYGRASRKNPAHWINGSQKNAKRARKDLNQILSLLTLAEERLAASWEGDGVPAAATAKVLPCIPRRALHTLVSLGGEAQKPGGAQ